MEHSIDSNYESTEAQEFQGHLPADLMQNAGPPEGPSVGLKDSEFTGTQGGMFIQLSVLSDIRYA